MSPLSSGRRSRRSALSLATVTLPLFLAGCGSSSDTTQVASLSGASTATDSATATSLSQEQVQQAMLDFSACMRENGIDMPDPTFDADGNAQGGFGGPDSGFDPRSTDFQTAQEACADTLQGVTLGRGPGGGAFDRTGIQDGFNAFTACLRDNGLQVDDVTLGDGPGAGGPGGPPPADDSGASGTPADGSGANGPGGFTGGPGGPPGDGQGGPNGAGFDPTARIIEQLGLDASDPAVTAAVDTCQPVLEQAFTPGGSTTTTAQGQ